MKTAATKTLVTIKQELDTHYQAGFVTETKRNSLHNRYLTSVKTGTENINYLMSHGIYDSTLASVTQEEKVNFESLKEQCSNLFKAVLKLPYSRLRPPPNVPPQDGKAKRARGTPSPLEAQAGAQEFAAAKAIEEVAAAATQAAKVATQAALAAADAVQQAADKAAAVPAAAQVPPEGSNTLAEKKSESEILHLKECLKQSESERTQLAKLQQDHAILVSHSHSIAQGSIETIHTELHVTHFTCRQQKKGAR